MTAPPLVWQTAIKYYRMCSFAQFSQEDIALQSRQKMLDSQSRSPYNTKKSPFRGLKLVPVNSIRLNVGPGQDQEWFNQNVI